MKYVFFGTPSFAAIILEKLIDASFIPQAVICNPDRPMGRKKIVTPPPTKILAEKYGIDILQPEILANYKLQITNYKPDFFVVAAYSKILPKEILEIPQLGTIGVHPSFLPEYRGPTPIQTAILNGDRETGVTLFLMDEKIDHGPVLVQRELGFSIFNFQFSILSQKLAELGADLLIEFLRKYENIRNYEKITGAPQDETQATYTKKFSSQDAYIEPQDLEKAEKEGGQIAIEIERKIRALNPEPGVYTIQNNKRAKLLEAKIKNDQLKLLKIQIEGKKPQTIYPIG